MIPASVLAEPARQRLVDDHHRDGPAGHHEQERDEEREPADAPPEEGGEGEPRKGQQEHDRHEVDGVADGRDLLGSAAASRGLRSG